jgi:hypothetical protein
MNRDEYCKLAFLNMHMVVSKKPSAQLKQSRNRSRFISFQIGKAKEWLNRS